jgi:hypothetical protein
MFKDLEAIVVTRMVRDQVKFTHKTEFAPATQATTLTRIDVQTPWNLHPVEYQLFVRVSRSLGSVCRNGLRIRL